MSAPDLGALGSLFNEALVDARAGGGFVFNNLVLPASAQSRLKFELVKACPDLLRLARIGLMSVEYAALSRGVSADFGEGALDNRMESAGVQEFEHAQGEGGVIGKFNLDLRAGVVVELKD